MNPIIKLDNISASYDGKQVLSDVSLTIFDDDYLGIIGPNGGGKTTLVKVMLGLKKADRGHVGYFKDGQPVENINIGYLPQYSSIDRNFPISVYDVVLSGLSSQKHFLLPFTSSQHQQVRDTLSRMELDSFAQRHIGSLSRTPTLTTGSENRCTRCLRPQTRNVLW